VSRLGALQERQFRLLWLGQTTSAIGDSVIYVALPFAVIQIGGGAAELGLVLASFTLARAGFIVVGGVWADRLPRRLVMLTCDAIRAAVQAAVAVALLTGVMEIWMFVVTSALGKCDLGNPAAARDPAGAALASELVRLDGLVDLHAGRTGARWPARRGGR
jgi:MFS family permease